MNSSHTKPVVALESTIISHGMPYPENLACASSIEQVVKDAGAHPATIGILDGEVHIGLTHSQLERFAKLGPACAKCSRRDVPFIISKKGNGATTVAATIWLAHRAGISIMATGGIGGVHRGAESSFDISADLTELGRTPVLVVCAGVKSILDIPRTLEFLETQGVAVITLGSDEFPAFFTRKSGCKSPLVADSIEEIARVLQASQKLQNQAGIVVAVPIPHEHEADGEEIEQAIQQSLVEATQQNIIGRDVTPFVLKRIYELTQGRSLAANIALVKNNARVAAEIAKYLEINCLNN